jgi:hypothetical protein
MTCASLSKRSTSPRAFHEGTTQVYFLLTRGRITAIIYLFWTVNGCPVGTFKRTRFWKKSGWVTIERKFGVVMFVLGRLN